MEFHKETDQEGKLNNPYPHLHFLIDTQIEEYMIRRTWERCGGGFEIDIKAVEAKEDVIGYMCKYLKKESVYNATMLKRCKRIWGRSRDLKTVLEMEKLTADVKESDWEYLRTYIFRTAESEKEKLQSDTRYDTLLKDIQNSKTF